MAPIARWEPVEPVSPLRRAGNVVAVLWRAALLPLLYGSLLWHPFVLVAARHGVPGWMGGVAALLLTLYLAGTMIATGGKPASRRLRADLRGLSRKRVFPIALRLFRDGEVYGHDEGIVWFEGGALRFDGLSTAFRLRPEDASLLPDAFDVEPRPLGAPVSSYGSLHARTAWGFDLAADSAVRVAFDPIKAPGYGSIHDALYRWLLDSPESTGETTLPPLVPPGVCGARKAIRPWRAKR